MQWNDNILEEDNMLVSEWNGKTRDNTCKDIEKFSSTIEFMSFVDECEETFVDSLSNHLSSWNQLSIKLMQDVLKVVSLNRFFGIEEFEEFLDELWSNVSFECFDFDCFVNNQLEEEFIDTL